MTRPQTILNPHTLEPVTLEYVITQALTNGPSSRPSGEMVDHVATAVRKYTRGDHGEGVTSLEDAITRAIVWVTGSRAGMYHVRRATHAVVEAITEARVIGVEYDALPYRLAIREGRGGADLEDIQPAQRERLLLQYVNSAHRQTDAVREHLMDELAERDALIRQLRADLVEAQAEVGR